jgi:4-amino-4-deoxy-L-arabinose transferase-like glycosyltransferase
MEQGRAERTAAPAALGGAAVPAGTQNGAAGAAGRRIARALAAFAIALALMTPGMRAPFDKDAETQSAQWIVDIVKHGNWLLPLDYYGYVERKPPMFYWLGSIWPWLRGGPITQTEARLPSLAAGASVAAMATDWAAADFGAVGGWLAFLFLVGSYGFAVRANVALTDMVMTLLLLGAWRAMRGPLNGASGRAGPLAAGVFLGLGVLTKGPVVIVLAGLAALIYIPLERDNPLRFARRGWPYGMLAIALAIGAAWYVPAFIAGRSRDWGGVFFDENFGHFMPAAMGGTGEAARPVYYIVARLLGAMMPLSLLAAPLLIAAFVGGFDESKRGAIRCYAALALAVVILFSLGSAKRDDYILPAIPPFAMLYAGLFVGALRDNTAAARVRDAIAWAIAVAMPVAMIALVAVMRAGIHLAPLQAHLESSDASYANIFLSGVRTLQIPFAIFIAATAAGGLIAISGLRRRTTAIAGAGIGLISLAGSVLFAGVLRPIEAGTVCLGPFVRRVEARVDGDRLYVAVNDEEVAWYYRGAIPHLPRELARIGPAGSRPTYLIARPTELVLLAPPVRRALVVVMHSGALGGNQPTLYLMRAPAATPVEAGAGLKTDTGSVK